MLHKDKCPKVLIRKFMYQTQKLAENFNTTFCIHLKYFCNEKIAMIYKKVKLYSKSLA